MRCRGMRGVANAAYLEGFLSPVLPSVAPYCVPGGIRVVSNLPYRSVVFSNTSGRPPHSDLTVRLEAFHHHFPLSLVLPEVPVDLFLLRVVLSYPLR
jgi:hypothetical protein